MGSTWTRSLSTAALGIQSLIGDLSYSGAVGTAVINANLAGADIAIIQSQMNTLPYFIIGKPSIKSPEGLKGRAAAVHIPGTSADFAMRLALSKVGISYKDIKAVTVGGAPARLAAVTGGQMDFTVVTDGERIQGEKLGLKVIIDMAKLNVPFQFNCTGDAEKISRTLTRRAGGLAMAEAIHFPKTTKTSRSRSCKNTPAACPGTCWREPTRPTPSCSSKTPTRRSKV
jgi:hypothetical protein